MLVSLFFVANVVCAKPPQKPSKEINPLRYSGATEQEDPEKAICFALYTVGDRTLKLTAQFYPLDVFPDYAVNERAMLEVRRDGGAWQEVAQAAIRKPSWTAHFRVEKWDDNRAAEYRVRYVSATYSGIITANPLDKAVIVVANLTCNGPEKIRNPVDQYGSTRGDVIENIKRLQPDILYFSGDQYYGKGNHYKGWMQFGKDYGEIIRNLPTITVPDDHDVSHGNLWGSNGKASQHPKGELGGYNIAPELVNQVHLSQCWHLPDPVDPTLIEQGITTYHTSWKWGGLSFAILADRMFKTGPGEVLGDSFKQSERIDHIKNPGYDLDALDPPAAILLGERQLNFLQAWTSDWEGVCMKVVLSQSPFINGPTRHGSPKNRILADLDSNSWPRSGRNRAVRAIRKSYSIHLNGDQHLSYAGFYGIDNYKDSGFMFCAPALRNSIYKRALVAEDYGLTELKGDFIDGMGNKFTLEACANPSPHTKANKMGEGIGIVRFNKNTREITCEAYPRYSLIGAAKEGDLWPSDAVQLTGYPITIHQYDNFAASSSWQLPELRIKGAKDAVVEVTCSESLEVVSVLRVAGSQFIPKVLKPGRYNIAIKANGKVVERKNVLAQQQAGALLDIRF